MEQIVTKIYNQLCKSNNQLFCECIYEEHALKQLAMIIRKNGNVNSISDFFIGSIAYDCNTNRCFDWNVGSTIQHFPATEIIDIIIKKSFKDRLLSSIGLAWVLGEFEIKNPKIIELLWDMVNKSDDSEVWWRAAFSLEKIGEGNAIHILKRSLKKEKSKTLTSYMENIADKRSIIGILLLCGSKNIKSVIYPKLESYVLCSKNDFVLMNSIWLLGRLQLFNSTLCAKIESILKTTTNSELQYYIFLSICENATLFSDLIMEHINSNNLLLKKMAYRGISYIQGLDSYSFLINKLNTETNDKIISEITQSIYRVSNNQLNNQLSLYQKLSYVENGLIYDDSDKWYSDPSIYDIFSLSEDPNDICLQIILHKILSLDEIINPVDLACGTGRILRFFIDKIKFTGTFYAIDRNKDMLNYLNKLIDRSRLYRVPITSMNSNISDFSIPNKSNLIMSSFGFPSQYSNKQQCIKELKTVSSNLMPKGLFITLGWDETFNDELNMFWYNYIPDDISADNYEEWRYIRAAKFDTPRNCNLSWYKTGLKVPLQFNNLNEAAHVIGNLFGRDAAYYTINNSKINWLMSLGITINTKEEIDKIIKNYERN